MSKLLTERLTQAGALLAVAGFAITYFKTEETLFALGVMGLVFIFVGFVLGVGHTIGYFREGSYLSGAMAAVVGIGAAIFLLLDNEFQMDEFSWLQFYGLSAVCLTLWVSIYWQRERHKANHKTCPDCAEEVLGQARVCKHCGYRWVDPDTA